MSDKNGRSREAPVWSPATMASVLRTSDRDTGVRIDYAVPSVSAVMTSEVYAVDADASLETAARIMAARHIGGMPVVRDHTPIGVVSMVDLVDPDRARSNDDGYPLYYRIASGGEALVLGDEGQEEALPMDEGRVADVMSPFVLSIEASASLVQAANLMLAEGVHRLLVREGTELVGIVTSTDLLRGLARMFVVAERMAEAAAAP